MSKTLSSDIMRSLLNESSKVTMKEAFNEDNMEIIKDEIRRSGITNENVVNKMAQDVAKELQTNFDKSNMSDDGIYYGVSITAAISNVVERITGKKPELKIESAKVEGKRKLTEAPEDEEEFEIADEEIPTEEPVEETPSEDEEMDSEEIEDEAQEDERETVEDDIEQPFYATVPEFDELRDVLVDLDYRLLLINDNMVVIGRLNGPDIEILTSNEPNASTEVEVSEQNDKAEEIEEKAEENGEKSYEYIWIKAPETLDKLIEQCNVIYLSPDMADEDKEQFAGKEASHESLMNYLMNELPESAKEEIEEDQVEEKLEDSEPSMEEEPIEEEPIEDIEDEVEEDEE